MTKTVLYDTYEKDKEKKDFKQMPVVALKNYTIDSKFNLMITALPQLNNMTTDFIFEYVIDGKVFPWYEQIVIFLIEQY